MRNVFPLASVHPDANIGSNVVIEPFAFIDKNVEIGEGTHVMSHAVILSGARIGKNCKIFPHSTIAAVPQDLKFRGEETLAIIGDNTTIRECATVNRGTASRGFTKIGNDCLIMAYSHVAHDCILHDHIIMGNTSQLAGEVEVFDYANLSGGILVHQFTRIGHHTMIQGGSRFSKDIPPFVMVGRDPTTYMGLNIVGLRRRGFSTERINHIQEIYSLIYRSGYNFSQAMKKIEATIPESADRELVLDFMRTSTRGLVRGNM